MAALLSHPSHADHKALLGLTAARGQCGLRWLGSGVLVLGLVVLATGCNQAQTQTKKKTIEVEVTRPITHEVCDQEEFTGRLEAVETVDIRPRVSGYIVKAIAREREGKEVKKGDVLFEIDPRSYEVDLLQAQANQRLAEAERNLQEKQLARAQTLRFKGVINQEELDQIGAALEKAAANVEAQKAAVKRAEIFLGYTKVLSPLDGLVSRSNVDAGNLVTADQTLLTTVVSESPVYTYFDVDERTYLEFLDNLKVEGTDLNSYMKDFKLPLAIRLAHETTFKHKGVVNFKDNRINASTGTIRLRAVFDNPDGVLKSGLFARIQLPTGSPRNELLIPEVALLSDQGNKYVYVIKPKGEDLQEGVVEYRSVTIGPLIDGQGKEKLRVIKNVGQKENGIGKDELVIVNGLQQVRPKMEVKVKPPKVTPRPPALPLVQLMKGDHPETPVLAKVAEANISRKDAKSAKEVHSESSEQ